MDMEGPRVPSIKRALKTQNPVVHHKHANFNMRIMQSQEARRANMQCGRMCRIAHWEDERTYVHELREIPRHLRDHTCPLNLRQTDFPRCMQAMVYLSMRACYWQMACYILQRRMHTQIRLWSKCLCLHFCPRTRLYLHIDVLRCTCCKMYILLYLTAFGVFHKYPAGCTGLCFV